MGAKDKMAKKRLFKKQETNKNEKGNYFKFDKGTVEKFAVKHRDIGDPVKLIIEVFGALYNLIRILNNKFSRKSVHIIP